MKFFCALAYSMRDFRSRFGDWVDAFWGYDVFIAHRRADASEYALLLYERLRAENISCFIDRAVYTPGTSLRSVTVRHVTKSTLFCLVGSPELLNLRSPADWVLNEIRTYLNTHSNDPKLLLLDFGDVIESELGKPDGKRRAEPILSELSFFMRHSENLISLSSQPSDDVLAIIKANLAGRRRDKSRLKFFQIVATALFLLFVGTGILGYLVQQELDRANATLAAAIASDLTFVADLPFTDRQRQAMWTLAVADASVKRFFVMRLVRTPREVVGVAPGFVQVSRALGLLWPSDDEARILFHSAVQGLRDVGLPNDMISELTVLAGNLTKEESAKTLDHILDRLQLAEGNDFHSLRALPRVVQALVPKANGEQAQRAIRSILRQIWRVRDVN